MQVQMNRVRAVVMAGGEGSRLRPMTVRRPKPLTPVANRPIMDHIVRLLRRHGLTEVVTTLHYLSDEIQSYFGDGSDFGVQISHSIEDLPLGTAGSVKGAEKLLKDAPFVIISGDALTDCDITKALEWHREKGSMATILLKRVPNPLDFGIVITSHDGKIERFLEKPGWSEVFSDTVNTGMYILEPEVLEMMEPGKAYDWSQDIFPRLLAEGKPLYGHIIDDYWSDIGAIDQYRVAQRDLLGGSVELEIPGEEIRPGVWVGQRTIIDETAEIEGPVVIGADCRIKARAVIGPNSSIGDGCLIEEGARVSDSIVWEHCYIGQNSTLEGTIVCQRTVVKRECSLREESVIGDHCLIDVGSKVLAGVRIWPDKMIERASTVTLPLVSGNRWRGALFRELGVAGLSNIEVTPEFATRFGLAYATVMAPGSRIVTSRDSSRSSRMTKRSIIASLLSAGCTVVDMRSSPIPITRHHVQAIGAAGAVSVRKFPGSSRHTLMEAFDRTGGYIATGVQRKIESAFFREEFRRVDSEELGRIDISTRAVDMYVQDFFRALGSHRPAGRPRIVIDYGFASIAPIFPAILNDLGVEAISLNAVNDAKAAPRSDEEIQSHLRNLAQIVASVGCQMGVLVTNEGERLWVVDDQGIPVGGHTLLGALCELVAATEENPKIALSVTAPDRLAEHLEGRGVHTVRTKASGRELMAKAQEEGVHFAGDEEGGFIFPVLTPGFDAMFSLASLICRLDRLGVKLSEVVGGLPEMFVRHTSAKCPHDLKGAVMRRMAEDHAGRAELELIDGIKLHFDGAWALILPDSYEPLIHVYAEAGSDREAAALADDYAGRVTQMTEEE